MKHRWVNYGEYQECRLCRVKRSWGARKGKAVREYEFYDGEVVSGKRVPPCEGAPRHLDPQGFPK
jgi:hypothetical protein